MARLPVTVTIGDERRSCWPPRAPRSSPPEPFLAGSAGWLALGGAVVNLIAAPSIYGGTDYTAFYSASGWITYIAQPTWVAWFAIASVAMVRPREPDMSPAASTAIA